MATFRTYDRTVFAALESTTGEGVAETLDMGDYIETIEPTFNITNRVYDRNVTRKSITPMLKTVTGTGSAGTTDDRPSALCEFTFGVELAGTGAYGTGAAVAQATQPVWGNLLKACGFVESTMWRCASNVAGLTDTGSEGRVPIIMRNRAWCSNEGGGAGSDWTNGDRQGRVLGDMHYDDPYFYFAQTGAIIPDPGTIGDKIFSAAPEMTGSFTSALVNPIVTMASTAVKMGWGYTLTSDERLGGNGLAASWPVGQDLSSSLTMQLRFGESGQYIEAVGCRGNVEFVFTAGDKCVMQFTFQGKLNKYSDTEDLAVPSPITQAVPPAVVGLAAAIGESAYGTADDDAKTNAVFNDFSLNIGNELSLRENMNDDVGYSATYITGRTGAMTIAPDATPASTTHTPWWNLLLSGKPVRMRLDMGVTAADDANSFVFKMPALQFEQVGDGERENVMTYEITGAMTGGDNGSSVMSEMDDSGAGATSGSKILNSRLGINNEFTLLYS